MRALIGKDLVLHRTTLLVAAPALVLYAGMFASFKDLHAVFTVFACIIALVLPMVLIAREDLFCSEAFICSLPVTRRQVVQAKFVISWAISLVLVFVSLGIFSLFASEQLHEIWSITTAYRVLLILSLGLGIALPFALRFGWIGLTVFGVGMQLLLMLGYFIAKTFAPSLRLPDVFSGMSQFIEAMHAWLGESLFMVAALAGLAIFNLASCNIAVALFKRKEL